MPLSISTESKWMHAQKHAAPLDPTKNFQVIQTKDGDSVFFSVGTDNVLYATREIRATITGWDIINLSKPISKEHFNDSAITVKNFRISQNPLDDMKYDLALAVTANNQDHLLLSLGNENTDKSWKNGVQWTLVPYNDPDYPAPSRIVIKDLLIITFPASTGQAVKRSCFVDILRFPNDPDGPVKRSYIGFDKEDKEPTWHEQLLKEDISGDNLQTCLGKMQGVTVPGIYTFGTIANKEQLIFNWEYNPYSKNRNSPGTITRFEVPAGSKSIASAIDKKGDSNLFISSSLGLSLYSVGQQRDRKPPNVLISGNSIVKSAIELKAATAKNVTAIWGLNREKDLFYLTCPAGKEINPSAWSVPIVILRKVDHFSFFTKYHAGSQTLFAETGSRQIVQLTQSSVTTEWSQRTIMLPALSYKDMIEFKGHTTHLRVVDENNIAKPNVPVFLKSTITTGVYIDNTYYVLDPDDFVEVKTDSTGAVSILQQANSITCACYTAHLEKSGGKQFNINPAKKSMEKLADLKSISDIPVTNIDGKVVPLVSDRSDKNKSKQATEFLNQCGKSAVNLPPDGSPAKITPSMQAAISDASIFVKAGDFFEMIGNELADGFKQFTMYPIEGICHAFITIGEASYHTILNCISAVARAATFVFDQLKIAIDDLIAWLGFLFLWPDIARTHKVIRSIIRVSVTKVKKDIRDVRKDVGHLFDFASKEMKKLAGIEDPTDKNGEYTKSVSSACPDIHSPQTSWASNHFKHGYNDTSPVEDPPDLDDEAKRLLKLVFDAAEKEEEIFEDTFKELKNKVSEDLADEKMGKLLLSFGEIFADAFIRSAKNLTVSLLKLLEYMVEISYDMLDQTIHIPIISTFYERFISEGDPLSLLDLFCLILAVPTTILYKVMVDEAPFADNAETNSLIHVKDWDALVKLLFPNTLEANGDKGKQVTLQRAGPSRLFMKINTAFQIGQVACNVFNLIVFDIQYAFLAADIDEATNTIQAFIKKLFWIPALGNLGAAIPTFVADLVRTGVMGELIGIASVIAVGKIINVAAFRAIFNDEISPESTKLWVTKVNPPINVCISSAVGGLLAGSIAENYETSIAWLMPGSCAITRFSVVSQNAAFFLMGISEKDPIPIAISLALFALGQTGVEISVALQIIGIEKYIKSWK